LVYVIILPPEPDKNIPADQMASVINKDALTTRILLAGKVPKIAAQYGTSEAADVVAQKLRGLGLKTIVCPDNELRQPFTNFKAERIQFGREEIIFSNKESKTVKIEPGDALLIISGRVDVPENREVKSTRTKLNLPATLLTGGIPIRRRVTETTIQTEMRTERFVRIYSKQQGSPGIEIKQTEFDYSCLFPNLISSSFPLFRDIITRIRNNFPRAVFDERLNGNYGLCLPNIGPWENVGILCHLIYRFVASQ